jgi:arabinose-5-phosphate isomerase
MNINNIINNIIKNEKIVLDKLNDILNNNINELERVIKRIINNKGKLIITGVGKSGLIGAKMASTLSSTGTPSFFVHSTEGLHGDLGMITKDDLVIAISNSGESEEVLKLISVLKKKKIEIIAITSNETSTLAKNANYILKIYDKEIVCPLKLAPMSSITCTLVLGDILASLLIIKKTFKEKDFALNHPGGSLGKKLLTQVKDIMVKDNLPFINENTEFKDILSIITKKKLGVGIVVDELNKLKGIITDGDLRRIIEKEKENVFKLKAKDFMSKNPKVINENEMAVKAKEYMVNNKIKELIVLDDNNNITGIIQLYDIEDL